MRHKVLKKIVGLFGYKLISKKTVKNERFLGNFNYLNLPKILEYLFENKLINSIIQIGANDGNRFDDLNLLIKKYKIKSILVEPISENFEQLKKNYNNIQNIKFENSAISVNNEISYLYKVKPEYLDRYGEHIKGISSFKKQHLIDHGVKKFHIEKQKINSISIKELLNKYEIKNFDLLFLDAEGYDGTIVNDFLDNSLINPYIIFEFIHIDNKIFKKLIQKLNEKNYKLFGIYENIICIPEDKNFLLFNPIRK
jgi:FkbM family methyltransferase